MMKELLNSLHFPQSQVNSILGHALAAVYSDTLREPLPERLKDLLDRLESHSLR